MITLLELANVFRISAFVLYVCMTFEKRILFFRNDRIYFLSICILGGLGFFPMIFQILPFVNWLGVQGILSVFLAIAAYSIRKWRDKNYDGYNYLAAVLLFIMIIQWFLLTSASNT
ncbi:MAG: hypothetical protein Q4G11_00450 [Gallicola sp.]|nr:hypothetical protein [Gallicola sp.]